MDVEGSGELIGQGEGRQQHQSHAEEGQSHQSRLAFSQSVVYACTAGNRSGNQQAGGDIHPELGSPGPDVLVFHHFLFELKLVEDQPVEQYPHQVQRNDASQ